MKHICMFGPLKKAIKGCRFWLDEDVKVAVVQRFRQRHMQRGSISWCIIGTVACLPACLPALVSVETGFSGFTPSPRRIVEWVSFEQPSFVQGLSVNPSSTTYSPVVYLKSHVNSYGGLNKIYLSTAQQTNCIVYLTVNFGLDNIVAITAEMSGLKEFL